MSTAGCIEKIFPRTLSHSVAADLFSERGNREAFEKEPEKFAEFLRENFPYPSAMAFLADLAAVEYACWSVEHMERQFSRPAHGAVINPLLRIVLVNNDVTPFFSEGKTLPAPGEVEPYEGFVLVWKGPESGRLYVEKADEEMLLALKFLSEEEPCLRGHELKVVNQAIDYCAREGVVLKAPYLVSRARQGLPEGENIPKRYATASVFTLQWHITNACDLHCRHCYDREKRSPLTAEEGFRIIDDFDRFCRDMNVRGHICFSGGNPFMSPHFYRLYEAAAEKGFGLSLLGNPVSEEELQCVIDISTPEYFQVSLEGLEAHNDFIRGEGFYRRVMDFLALLKKKQLPSAVMLTLTKANIDQVLPLADILREKTDYFTFNRLSQVGEGASLSLPECGRFRSFLDSYTRAARTNPVAGFKDNLFNILREQEGVSPFGGCTGFGCGAAFNFVALLPDGEVHACRKFPSPIGNILESDFGTIYESPEAKRYRMGPEPCKECRLRTVCGGCMAVVHGMGLDPFRDKDPYCFIDGQ